MKHLDLFSGIGGFALAARWTGFIETVGFCEIEPFAQKVLKKHWPEVPINVDIKSLKNEGQYGTIDIITGGFPCQPYSVAGKQAGKEDDRDLWPEMFRIIKEFKPTWIVGENVAGFVNMELNRTISDLESEGYEVQPFIIPACAVGAPHRRDRVWIIAYNDEARLQATRAKPSTTGTKQHRKLGAILENSGRELRKGASEQEKDGQETKGRSSDKPKRSSEMGLGSNTKSFYAQGLHQKSGKGEPWGSCWWSTEPDVGRVANGVSSRVDRLKGLGNAIVPQIAYQILKELK